MVMVPPGCGGSPAFTVLVVALTATTPLCTCFGAAVGGVNLAVAFFAVVAELRAASAVVADVDNAAVLVVDEVSFGAVAAIVDAVVDDVSSAFGSGEETAAFFELPPQLAAMSVAMANMPITRPDGLRVAPLRPRCLTVMISPRRPLVVASYLPHCTMSVAIW